MEGNEGLLSREELAQYLGVTPPMITGYIKKGLIKKKHYMEVGKRKYYLEEFKEDIKREIQGKQDLSFVLREKSKKVVKEKEKKEEWLRGVHQEVDYNGSSSSSSSSSNSRSSIRNSNKSNDFIEIEQEAANIDPDLFGQLKAVEQKYKAFKVKFEAEVLMKKHVPSDEIEEIWKHQLLVMKAKIQSIRGEIANLINEFIPDPENRKIVLKRVEDIQDEICTELSTM